MAYRHGNRERGTPRSGYGWQFRLDGDGIFHGAGYYGQYGLVVPGTDAVLSFTGASNDKASIFRILWDTLIPALQSGVMPTASEELRDTLPPAPGDGGMHHAGERYRFPENELSLEEMGFEGAEGGVCTLSLRIGGRDCRLCTEGCRFHTSRLAIEERDIPFPFDAPRIYPLVSASHGWTGTDQLHLRTVFLQTPYIYDWQLVYSGDALSVTLSPNVGRGIAFRGRQV